MSEIAVLGGHEDDLTMAGGYLEVAEVAAMYWIKHGPDDSMPIPILYNYRHAIELTLKWLIRLAARYLVEGGYTKENLNPEKLDGSWTRTTLSSSRTGSTATWGSWRSEPRTTALTALHDSCWTGSTAKMRLVRASGMP